MKRKEETATDNKFTQTQKIGAFEKSANSELNDILKKVYIALKEKGYNPVNQIVGYILSGDPTYITASSNARNLISKVERDELLEEIVDYYLKNNL